MTRPEALAALHGLAATLTDADPAAAGARLRERIAGHEEAGALADVLAEFGAEAVIRARRPSATWPPAIERRGA